MRYEHNLPFTHIIVIDKVYTLIFVVAVSNVAIVIADKSSRIYVYVKSLLIEIK